MNKLDTITHYINGANVDTKAAATATSTTPPSENP